MNPNEAIKELVGQNCWYVSAGGATAPSFTLVLGEKVLRERALRNLAHPLEFRTNRGSVELLVWCSWRLQSTTQVFASSDQGEFGLQVLKNVEGTTILETNCYPPAWDLSIRFSNGLELSIFCDHIEPNCSISQNWEFSGPRGYVATGPGTSWSEDLTALA